MSNNLEFWESVEKTNPIHTKKITGTGRKLTAINAQQQIKNATSKWGMYGKTWGLKHVKLDYITGLTENQILAVAQAEFYYPEGSFEIGSSILVQGWYKQSYNSVDDDFLKKLETDMTTKALSKLGFNADVFLGYYDDNKYVAKMNEEFNSPREKVKYNKEMAIRAIAAGTSFADFSKAVDTNDEHKAEYERLQAENGNSKG